VSGEVPAHRSSPSPTGQERLRVKGRDRTHLTDLTYQVDAVRAALEGESPPVPVKPVLCFVGAEWNPFERSFTINGVLVTSRGSLRRRLCKRGPIPSARRAALERLLAARLPAAVPRSPNRANQA
jgi:hypothetical protein